MVPCFRWPSVSTCCPLGSREAHRLLAPSSFTHDAGLRPKRKVSALPISHTPILVRGFISGLTYGSLSLRPVDLLAALVGANQVFTQPTAAFTSGLSADWSPAPPPGITTEVTGQAPLAGLSPARTPTSIAATAYDTCRHAGAAEHQVHFANNNILRVRITELGCRLAQHRHHAIAGSHDICKSGRDIRERDRILSFLTTAQSFTRKAAQMRHFHASCNQLSRGSSWSLLHGPYSPAL